MRGKHIELAAGIVIGATLFGGGTAVAAGLLAEPSTQTFYVGNQQIQLEAYAIGGYNYVKLRDVGQAADFNVYYDGARNAAVIEPDSPYTGEAPTGPMVTDDYSAQANPMIFNGELTKEVYNAMRDTVLHREEIADGRRKPLSMGTITRYGAVDTAATAIGGYPVYEVIALDDGGYGYNAKYLDTYAEAVAHTQDFVDSLSGLTDKEKVEQIVWYVCDRLTYSVAYPNVNTVLSKDTEIPGACMVYAYCVRFLCDRAGIPCLFVCGDNHQWNKVYADGQWWDVDATNADVPDPTLRSMITALQAGGLRHADIQPEITRFMQEVLVPGSTK